MFYITNFILTIFRDFMIKLNRGALMKNYVIISTAYNNEARLYAANTTNLINEVQKIHDTWPTATAAFGRFITASSMMGLMNKNDETISLKIKGSGPIGWMLVETNACGHIKGDILNPHVYIRSKIKGKLDVGAAIGNGFLNVVKNLNMKHMFSSSVELLSSEIAEDFANYFLLSEQIKTAVSLGVLIEQSKFVAASGGFIIQLLPNASEDTILKIENAINKVGPVSSWFNNKKSAEELISFLANNSEKILEKKEIKYYCNCNKDYYLKSLITLDDKTLDDLISDGQVEIICRYCKKKHIFNKDELIEIKKIRK